MGEIELAQVMKQWMTFVNTVIKLGSMKCSLIFEWLRN
jgi:hypothetical protein